MMRFQNIPIHPLLKGYIEKLWLFESDGKALRNDIKLIVPNGRVKLAIPYKNGIVAAVDGRSHFTREHSITLVGLMDMPSTMDIATDGASGTICAEFNPNGAYRFFHLALSDIRNRIFSLTDILSKTAKQLEEQMANSGSAEEKAGLFQQFLVGQFFQQKEDSIFEYCIENIRSSGGRITLRELEKKTGYSSRWLNMKFIEKLGVSPKSFAAITRFKQYYEILCGDAPGKLAHNDFYYYYYDQSHFIKDFKRFTGLTPTALEKKLNEFGRIFYNV